MSRTRLSWAILLVLAFASLAASPTWAAAHCGWSGYSYAGLRADAASAGVSARLTAVRAPQVQNGHVAAWVGVGGAGQGPNGTAVWAQIGLYAIPGGPSRLYYEVSQGAEPKLTILRSSVAVGDSYTVAVREVDRRPGFWRVWVDDKAVSRPIFLPGSHKSFRPVATTETWDGGVPSCNAFSYRFDTVKVADGAGWQPLKRFRWLQDPGYRVLARGDGGFVAGRATS